VGDDDVFGTEPAGKEYLVGSKDILNITVWGHEDLNVTVTVSIDGTINFPLLGEVYVNGLTVEDIRKVIRRLLAKDYIVDPNVDVAVKEFNSKSIFIFGDVEGPGEYKLKGYTTVLDLIPMAGGTRGGLEKTMLITRKKQDVKVSDGKEEIKEKMAVKIVDLQRLLVHGDLSQNLHIESGDIIYVYSPETKGPGMYIYILGAVKNPGLFAYRKGLMVLDAVIMAGGFTDMASPNSTVVVRGKGENKQSIRVKMGDIMKRGDRSKDVVLEPDDFVIVHESWL